MDLGKRSSVVAEELARSSNAELLERLSSGVHARRVSMVDEWVGTVSWADRNVVDTPEGAATLTEGFLDTGVPIAGAGAPLVSEFGLMELIATLERSPDGGRASVGRVIGCAWRLPQIYAQVLAGRCSTWRAEQVADLTRPLSPEAAAGVDVQLAFAVGTCTWAQVERLVAEAIARFDPDLAEQQRKDAADHRHFHIEADQADINGLVPVRGLMDVADAGDLDDAVGRRATLRGRLGHEDSLDVRRSEAVGEMARHDLMLDLEIVGEDTGEITMASPGRKAELHVHLSDAAITGDGATRPEGVVGRCEETNSPVLAEQIRSGCGPAALSSSAPSSTSPITCRSTPPRSPTGSAARSSGATTTAPSPAAVATPATATSTTPTPTPTAAPPAPATSCPLCRRHHRAKTHSDWRYVIVQPGTYLWTSPNNRHFLVNHRDTRALDPPRRLDPATVDQVHDYETDWPQVPTTSTCPGTGHPPDE